MRTVAFIILLAMNAGVHSQIPPKPPTMPPTIPRGMSAEQSPTNDQILALLKAQTSAIQSMGTQLDDMEARLAKLEDKGKKK
ncbi:MAG: hypothetical protein JWQ73_485 [Variovorax sp.]|nr:hypothetical protein [Variovorax sp.]